MKVIEASEIPNEEKVYLKKDILGWRVVHPIKNEDGTTNWFNLIFGSKSNMVFLIMLLIVGVALYFGVNELLSAYKDVNANPCLYCEDCANFFNNIKSDWGVAV